ncbi:DNA-3-methyladenine glycosylase III [Malonomonas rubra DSM 5091]|uniref:DNA-3-methyladenine glycosylase III n=1 Tax=Malonomonas rubra DSM 5091 TaxID=1122189 RepID=A0A1M6IL40_MALRU|nr:endonuclease III domain-containing protein [Malonomonas rubra]SHJ35119.1 DNA-3-methyladenine glycosylase III [Malonomonas rubra DSM 5091]
MLDLKSVYQRLFDYYGPRHWWPADTPFEMAVGAILTQNTNWKNVEQAIGNLKQANVLDCHSVAGLPVARLEEFIRPSGFFRQKAERLRLFSQHLLDHHQGSLDILLQQPLNLAREELLSLKGVGPETADSILLYAGDLPSFVVDAYTGRLFSRLGVLHGKEKYAEIRDFFMANLPENSELYNEFHALIVMQCKEHCRKKPLCETCPLADDCAHQQQNP